jgi:PAS domain S-box-containing protein
MAQMERFSDISVGRHLRNLAVFEIAFYLAYRYGMSVFSDSPSPLWFPDSVLLSTLLLTPPGAWWMYFIAQIPIRFLVAVPVGMPVWFVPVGLLNDSLKALLSAFLLRRGAEAGRWFTTVRGFAKYLLIAVTLSPALSAVGGAISLRSDFWPTWVQWLLGDALASIVLTPLLYCLVQESPIIRPRISLRFIEGCCLATGLIAGAYVAFNTDWSSLRNPGFLLYLPTPFLIWAAVRFGPLGTSSALFVVSMMVTFGGVYGRGPFAATASDAVVLSVQLFLLVPSIAILFLAVLGQQQRQTHSALRESELRFRSLVDTAPVMVWMSDTNGMCTFVNKPWLDFTGLPLESQLGEGWLDSVHPIDRNRVNEHYLRAFHQQTSLMMEYRLQRSDGVHRWVLDNGFPRFGPEGVFLGYIGSCTDISHHKEAEEKLTILPYEVKSAQEAERRRIGQELHDDLGQRVVALSLGITYLSQQIGGDEQISARFEDLRQDATDIVKEIARISHKLRPAGLENLGLSTALQSLCEKSRDPSRMNIVFTQHGELPQHIPWLSSIALYRVAQEALRNALTHSGSDLVNIELTATQSCLLMAITDQGCGFDVENARTGLGLSGMEHRMKEIDGKLTIESTPGSGTTVTASVPLAAQETADSASA